jgi:N-acetyl-D-muramate 6-phosphate phosphatase
MALDTSRIRALCFDVDGTLNDTDDHYVEITLRILRPFNRIAPKLNTPKLARRFVMWAEAPGNALLGIPDTLGIDDELARLSNWLNRHNQNSFGHVRLIDGVRTMLETMHARYPVSVVSARAEAKTRHFLAQAGLEHLFVAVAGAQTVEYTKPYPHPIRYVAEQMGVPPEACLMIGDTTVDIRAGKAAGAQTVGVLCGFGEEPELRRHGADLILDSTAELINVL